MIIQSIPLSSPKSGGGFSALVGIPRFPGGGGGPPPASAYILSEEDDYERPFSDSDDDYDDASIHLSSSFPRGSSIKEVIYEVDDTDIRQQPSGDDLDRVYTMGSNADPNRHNNVINCISRNNSRSSDENTLKDEYSHIIDLTQAPSTVSAGSSSKNPTELMIHTMASRSCNNSIIDLYDDDEDNVDCQKKKQDNTDQSYLPSTWDCAAADTASSMIFESFGICTNSSSISFVEDDGNTNAGDIKKVKTDQQQGVSASSVEEEKEIEVEEVGVVVKNHHEINNNEDLVPYGDCGGSDIMQQAYSLFLLDCPSLTTPPILSPAHGGVNEIYLLSNKNRQQGNHPFQSPRAIGTPLHHDDVIVEDTKTEQDYNDDELYQYQQHSFEDGDFNANDNNRCRRKRRMSPVMMVDVTQM